MPSTLRRVDNLLSKLEGLFSSIRLAIAARTLARKPPHAVFTELTVNTKKNSKRWTQSDSDGPLISIVAVSYRQPDALRVFLASLACQTQKNFELIVLHDGPHQETANVLSEFSIKSHKPVIYIETPVRHNDYGHSLRDQGLKIATGEFIVITNGDNYYTPNFIELISEALMGNKCDVVVWDMVHSHDNPGFRKQGSYKYFSVLPIRCYCDMGCIAARTSLAKSVGFRDKTHDGDATYLEDILSSKGTSAAVHKISKILMVHN